MLYDPADHYEPEETKEYFEKKSKVYERLMRIKQSGKIFQKKDKQKIEAKQQKKRSLVSMFSLIFSWAYFGDKLSACIKHGCVTPLCSIALFGIIYKA